MRIGISMFLILAVVARVCPMELQQNPASLLRVQQLRSLDFSDSRAVALAALLAPLKEEAQVIQKKMELFATLLKQERWNEAGVKETIAEYQELAKYVDTFPLRYQLLLSKVRFAYRMDRGADQLVKEHSTVFGDVTFGLSRYRGVMFHVKRACDTFEDVGESIRYSHLPLCRYAVSSLQTYQKWSSSEYKGLQNYLNETAELLLNHIRDRELDKDEQEKLEREKQKVEHPWFLADLRGKWSFPQFSGYRIEQAPRLMAGGPELKPL